MHSLPTRLLTRTVAPAGEPVSLSEAKLHLRVDTATEDAPITDLIAVARTAAEEYLRRSLMTQTWKLAFDGYAPLEAELPRGPVQSVTGVTQFARDGTSQVVSAGAYSLNAARDVLAFDTPLIAFRVEIVYVTGYGDASAVPKPLKQGMLAHIAALYEHRGDTQARAVPDAALALYHPYREIRL